MKIKIAGISGYLGTQIASKLKLKGHDVSGITREKLYGHWGLLSKEIEGANVIINLAGAAILQRWTKKNKETIYSSRIETSKNLVNAIKLLDQQKQPQKFISASAIGIYKSGMVHDENSFNFDEGFVGKVVKDWEDTLNDIPSSIQTNIFRIGLVLGKNAKTIKNLILPFKLGLGAAIGSGKQAFPFIHEKDVINAFIWAIEDYSQSNTFNLVAPQQISNKIFTKELAKQLNRPAIFVIPEFILKTFFGEAFILLTESPQVEAAALKKAGFKFRFPTIKSSLTDILS